MPLKTLDELEHQMRRKSVAIRRQILRQYPQIDHVPEGPAEDAFYVWVKGKKRYPLFQFEEGRPLPLIKDLIRLFGGPSRGWSIALWLVSDHPALDPAGPPVSILRSNPQRVLKLAELRLHAYDWT